MIFVNINQPENTRRVAPVGDFDKVYLPKSILLIIPHEKKTHQMRNKKRTRLGEEKKEEGREKREEGRKEKREERREEKRE